MKITRRTRTVLQRQKVSIIDAIYFILYPVQYITASSLLNLRNKSSIVRRIPFYFKDHERKLKDDVFTRLYTVSKIQFITLCDLARTQVEKKQRKKCSTFPAIYI